MNPFLAKNRDKLYGVRCHSIKSQGSRLIYFHNPTHPNGLKVLNSICYTNQISPHFAFKFHNHNIAF